MPWIYNPTAQVQTAKGFNGSMLSFPSRKKIYVSPEQMSAYVWNLIRERKLANRGGDPKPRPARKPAPVRVPVSKAKVKATPKTSPRSADPDTSSSHHQTRDKVQTESLGSDSVSKKLKAEKKQTDVKKKVVTQGNSKTKIETDVAEKPKKRRKRTFKRKD